MKQLAKLADAGMAQSPLAVHIPDKPGVINAVDVKAVISMSDALRIAVRELGMGYLAPVDVSRLDASQRQQIALQLLMERDTGIEGYEYQKGIRARVRDAMQE